MQLGTLDIEVYDTTNPDETWAQAKYLVHGFDDILWTDDWEAAVRYLEESVVALMKSQKGDLELD